MLLDKDKFCRTVFDLPSKKSEGKSFMVRRLLTLAGKPVLSAHNQPILTSRSELSKKCFTNSRLFYYSLPIKKYSRFKPYNKARLEPTNEVYQNKPELVFQFPKIAGNIISLEIKANIFPEFYQSSEQFMQLQTADKRPTIKAVKLQKSNFIRENTDFSILSVAEKLHIESQIEVHRQAYGCDGEAFCRSLTDKKPFLEIRNAYICDKPETVTPCLSLNLSINEIKDFTLNNQETVLEPSNNFFKTDIKCDRPIQIHTRNTQFSISDYDFRNEIGKNLVLIAKSDLYPKFGNIDFKTTVSTAKAVSGFSNRNPEFIERSANLIKAGYSFNITSQHFLSKKPDVQRSVFERIIAGNKLPSVSKGDCSSGLAVRFQNKAYRLKLKLRLPHLRFRPAEKEFSFLQSYNPNLAVSIPTIIKVRFTLKREKDGRWNNMNFSARELESLYSRVNFCHSIFRLRFLTKSQAKYSIKKIKRVLSQSLPFATRVRNIKQEYLRGNISEGLKYSDSFSISLPSLFHDFIGIIGRPLSFLMSITHLNFTDIALPFARRRAKLIKADFNLDSFCPEWGKKRRIEKYLQKAVSSFSPSFTEFKMPRKKLLQAPLAKSCKVGSSKPVVPPEVFLISENREVFTHFATSCRFLKDFSILDGIPDQIKSEFELDLSILDRETPKFLTTDIIPPPAWHKILKFFKCRLRLLPYPFGFPTFVHRASKMILQAKDFKAKAVDKGSSRLLVQSFHFTQSNRVHRSKYSLKNPKIFVFPVNKANSDQRFKIAYCDLWFATEKSFIQSPNIDCFAYSWQLRSKKKIRLQNYTFEKTRSILESQRFFEVSRGSILFSYHEKEVKSLELSVPQTQKLLINSISLRNYPALGRFKAPFAEIARKTENFAISETELSAKVNYVEKSFNYIPQYREILAFYHSLPIKSDIILYESIWKARFRQLFFPYAPSLPGLPADSEGFFEIDDTTQVQSYAPYEDLRISQIFTSFFEEQGKNKEENYCAEFIHAKVKVEKFHQKLHKHENSIAYKIRKAANFKNRPKKALFTILKGLSEKKYMLQQETPISLEKTVKSVPKSFSYSNSFSDNKPIAIAPSTPDFSSRFSLDSVHWVILLNSFLKISLSALKFRHTFYKVPDNRINLSLIAEIQPPEFLSGKVGGDWYVYNARRPEFYARAELSYDKLSIGISEEKLNFVSNTCHNNFAYCFYSNKNSKLSFVDKANVNHYATFTGKVKFKRILDRTTEIQVYDFRMNGKYVPALNKTRFKAGRLRPSRDDFRPGFIPDWYDIRMDDNYQSVDILKEKAKNLHYI